MRRALFGSHRERVEAASAIQASRRRRRISLELDEFERPGGRAQMEPSPEVEAYLAALSVADRPRRASVDCPRGVRGPDAVESPRGDTKQAPIVPDLNEDVFGYEDPEFSPWGQLKALQEQQQQQAAAMEQECTGGSTPESPALGIAHGPSVTGLKGMTMENPPDSGRAPGVGRTPAARGAGVFASARRACASLVRKTAGSGNSPLEPLSFDRNAMVSIRDDSVSSHNGDVMRARIAGEEPLGGAQEPVGVCPPVSLPAGQGRFPDMFPVETSGAGQRQGGVGRFPDMMDDGAPCFKAPAAASVRGVGPRWEEGRLRGWGDWPAVESTLANPELAQAQAALVTGSASASHLLFAVAGPGKT